MAAKVSSEYDVIVVGGGPGGSTCASFLGMKGYNVLLLDRAKFPRDKTCGDAISGKSMKILEELSLIDQVEKHPHGRITGVTFSSPNGAMVSIPFAHNEKGITHGYCSRREVYDNILFQNAKKHATVIEQFNVTDVIKDANNAIIGVKGSNLASKENLEFRAKVVVGADGATSVIANKLGVSEVQPKHHCVAVRAYYSGIKGLTNDIELHFINSCLPGYFWIFPEEDGTANVGVGMVLEDMREKNVNLEKAMLEAIANDPLFKERFADAKQTSPVRGWNLPFASFKRKATADNVVLIGDAASLIDPFTGEGIGNAMLSGKTASEVIDEALRAGDTSATKLSVYEQRLWAEINDEVQTSYRLQQLGKNKLFGKFLLNLIVGKAQKNPQIRNDLSGMLANEEAKKGLTNMGFYLRLLMP